MSCKSDVQFPGDIEPDMRLANVSPGVVTIFRRPEVLPSNPSDADALLMSLGLENSMEGTAGYFSGPEGSVNDSDSEGLEVLGKGNPDSLSAVIQGCEYEPSGVIGLLS